MPQFAHSGFFLQDYLLLDAPLHNSSEPPLLSVVVPMDSGRSTRITQ